MFAVKEKIIQQIDDIQDEEMLNNLQLILQNMYSKNSIIILNNEQKAKIAQGEKDFAEGKFHTTDALFDELINS